MSKTTETTTKKNTTSHVLTGTTGSPSSSNPSRSPSPGPDVNPCPDLALALHLLKHPPVVSLWSLLLLLQVPQQQVAVVWLRCHSRASMPGRNDVSIEKGKLMIGW